MTEEILTTAIEETTEGFVFKNELTLKNAAIAAGGALIFEAAKFGVKKTAPLATKGINKVKSLFKKDKKEVVEEKEWQ